MSFTSVFGSGSISRPLRHFSGEQGAFLNPWLIRAGSLVAFFLIAKQFHYELLFMGLRGSPHQGRYGLIYGIAAILILLLLQAVMSCSFTRKDAVCGRKFLLYQGCVLLIAVTLRTVCVLYDVGNAPGSTFTDLLIILLKEQPLIWLIHGTAQAAIFFTARKLRFSAYKHN